MGRHTPRRKVMLAKEMGMGIEDTIRQIRLHMARHKLSIGFGKRPSAHGYHSF
jgi:hypothetical protein